MHKLHIKTIVLGLIAILLLAGAWAFKEATDNSGYSAVYLRSGDIYFGQLSWFPKPHITNAWYLERTAGKDSQPQIGIMPMKNVFWSPSPTLYLNPAEIVWWTKIQSGSQMAKALANGGAPQGNSANQTGFQGPTTPPPGSGSTSGTTTSPANE